MISVSLTLVAAELALRFRDFHYSPISIHLAGHANDWRMYHAFTQRYQEDKLGRVYIYDADLFWRAIPGLKQINSQGYRGQVLPAQKAAGTYRIFAVGDSNTIGMREPLGGANWPADLEALFHDARVTVTNAGVDGYSSYQGLRRLQGTLQYQPDMALISFGANDAHMVTKSDADYAHDVTRKLVARGGYLMRLKLAQLVLSLVDRKWSRSKVVVPRVDIAEYKRNLTDMIDLCRQNGIQAVLLTRPFHGACDDLGWWRHYGPQYNQVTRDVAAEQRVPCVDVYDYFKDRDSEFIDESHFNRAAHQEAAELIYRSIRPLVKGAQSSLRYQGTLTTMMRLSP